MNTTLQFVIPTVLGVESLVSMELKKLGLSDVTAENGRVLCRGTVADIPRINLNLRTGARLLIRLGECTVRTFDQLFESTRALPWEDFIPKPVNSPSRAIPSIPPCSLCPPVRPL